VGRQGPYRFIFGDAAPAAPRASNGLPAGSCDDREIRLCSTQLRERISRSESHEQKYDSGVLQISEVRNPPCLKLWRTSEIGTPVPDHPRSGESQRTQIAGSRHGTDSLMSRAHSSLPSPARHPARGLRPASRAGCSQHRCARMRGDYFCDSGAHNGCRDPDRSLALPDSALESERTDPGSLMLLCGAAPPLPRKTPDHARRRADDAMSGDAGQVRDALSALRRIRYKAPPR
jgi:hypothetical protein